MDTKSKAALLSLLIPGLGQFYNKENRKGVIFFIIGFVSLLNGLLFLAVRAIAAYEAYDRAKKIESGEPEPIVENEPEEEEGSEEVTKTEAPAAPPAEPKEDILLKSILAMTTEDRYYQFDEIRTTMESKYGGPQDWLTNAWVGRNLSSLGFTEKRRVATGTEVMLTTAKVLVKAREKGLFA